jgi:hypothetical protein
MFLSVPLLGVSYQSFWRREHIHKKGSYSNIMYWIWDINIQILMKFFLKGEHWTWVIHLHYKPCVIYLPNVIFNVNLFSFLRVWQYCTPFPFLALVRSKGKLTSTSLVYVTAFQPSTGIKDGSMGWVFFYYFWGRMESVNYSFLKVRV